MSTRLMQVSAVSVALLSATFWSPVVSADCGPLPNSMWYWQTSQEMGPVTTEVGYENFRTAGRSGNAFADVVTTTFQDVLLRCDAINPGNQGAVPGHSYTRLLERVVIAMSMESGVKVCENAAHKADLADVCPAGPQERR